MTRPRVLIAGLGDTGVLTAIRLARHADVVGISPKPALVSGQELGLRLTRPDRWARDYHLSFDQVRGLDRVRRVHGVLEALDLDDRNVRVRLGDGSTSLEPYDVLVISTGVTNGFWRRPDLQSADEVDAGLRATNSQLARSATVAVIGGGTAAVSSAANIARTWPEKSVDLYFPGDRALPGHHRRVWERIRGQLEDAGVGIHSGHRAVVPPGFAVDRITEGQVRWSTGQPEARAEAVVWAIGRARPNTGWLSAEVLDDDGFVRTRPDLRVEGVEGIFAIGDVAATDPLRSSARNFTYKLLARNIRAHLDGRPLKTFRAPGRRWGSVLGIQPEGLQLFAPNGRAFRVPTWGNETVLQPWIVNRGFYRGVRGWQRLSRGS